MTEKIKASNEELDKAVENTLSKPLKEFVDNLDVKLTDFTQDDTGGDIPLTNMQQMEQKSSHPSPWPWMVHLTYIIRKATAITITRMTPLNHFNHYLPVARKVLLRHCHTKTHGILMTWKVGNEVTVTNNIISSKRDTIRSINKIDVMIGYCQLYRIS